MDKREKSPLSLEELIQSAGLKKIFIAGQLGVTRSWVYKKEKNPGEWKVREIHRLSEILGQPAEVVFAAIIQAYHPAD